MWNRFICYLSGRHDYGVSCEPGTIFLRCVHCGKRSAGWAVAAKAVAKIAPPANARLVAAARTRILPFDRASALTARES